MLQKAYWLNVCLSHTEKQSEQFFFADFCKLNDSYVKRMK